MLKSPPENYENRYMNSAVSGYKINIEKSVAFLHTNNFCLKQIKKAIQFTTSSKRIRKFGLPFSLYHCWLLSEKIVASIILQGNLFCSPSMALPTLGSFRICLSVLWPHLPHSENTGPSSLPSSQYRTFST